MSAYTGPHPINEEARPLTSTVVDGFTCCQTRRAAVRILSICALAMPAALRSQSAIAIKGWCRRDPVIKIGDLTAHIVLASYAEMDDLATGPAQFVIRVPTATPTRFVASDPGFGHHGYDVRFVESRELIANDRFTEVQVEAHAPAANLPEGPLPILVTFTPLGDGRPAPGQAEGWANEWVTLRSNLAAIDFKTPPADEPDDMPPSGARDKKTKEKGNKGRGKKKSR